MRVVYERDTVKVLIETKPFAGQSFDPIELKILPILIWRYPKVHIFLGGSGVPTRCPLWAPSIALPPEIRARSL